jgi:hypothetical protein
VHVTVTSGQQHDPTSAYSQLNPTQLRQVAQHLIQGFEGKSNPQSQQYAQMDPNTATPEQVAAMHQHAAQNPLASWAKRCAIQ